jgi:putative ABC transport system ATP-binding protein
VALARAFAMRPQLLLADEPTGNLDAATGAQVIELMFDMNAEAGTTLILVTHDEALAHRCGRTLRLEDRSRPCRELPCLSRLFCPNWSGWFQWR